MTMPSNDILSLDLPDCAERSWARQAIGLLQGDARRSADTHLIKPVFPGLQDISIYLKDESTHPTGSLKHRLARSLILYGICNGYILQGTTLVEASSGSTAVSEAYFARILGLPFIAVMPKTTSPQKIEAIKRFGGRCHFVDRSDQVYQAAQQIADETHGHYLDQFTNAERATDWRGNNNVAESIFAQMEKEPDPTPEWVVMSAGTGGTSATIGRYIRYRSLSTRLCVADVENSVFFDSYRSGDRTLVSDKGSRIEGIGRPRVEPSFLPTVIDHMMRIPDAASLAAMYVLSDRIFRQVGGSTGTNFYCLCEIAAQMKREKRKGSLVTLICDSGARYHDTYYNADWLKEKGFQLQPYIDQLNRFLDTGTFQTSLTQ
ncbi:PLP-dependent cysteine synthase family protein [Martelella sp. HB161492]|uniref:PLP-dependent cysteine synthase family protein n=1 Tax=Martelella sp. HB161492 TaxID=2720726 RepID=UPI002484C777|nr:PLP-dependent cysteine synthase family protein [Martelella sp. HB161492]